MSRKNKGERDEIECIKLIYLLNEQKEYDKLVQIFGQDAEEGICLINPNTNRVYNDVSEIKKANNPFIKADIIIKINKTEDIYNTSIKSLNNAPPAILNHTPRCAKVFQNGCLKNELFNIDLLISEYIIKRDDNQISEDIRLNNLDGFITNIDIRKSFVKLLSYFIFQGTGSKLSERPCNAIMTYKNKNDIHFNSYTTIVEKDDYCDVIVDNCKLSLRDKGMPTKPNELCVPWIYIQKNKDGTSKLKGSIHIRTRNV